MGEYDGEERRADSWGRRDHDHTCEANQKNMKEWVADKMCIMKKEILGTTAPTKARVAIVLSVMLLMLAASLGSAWRTIAAAQDSTEIHARNTADIGHNKEDIQEGKEQRAILSSRIESMEERQIMMYGDVKKMLSIVERELE